VLCIRERERERVLNTMLIESKEDAIKLKKNDDAKETDITVPEATIIWYHSLIATCYKTKSLR
jgi:hypothetical protein